MNKLKEQNIDAVRKKRNTYFEKGSQYLDLLSRENTSSTLSRNRNVSSLLLLS